MDITPFVYPPHDQAGVEVSPVITALFNFAVDEGTVDKHTAYLIKKSSDYASNSIQTVETTVTLERINLADSNPYTGLDYGTDEDAGNKYRSKIVIKPLSALEDHTEYSVIISKDIGAKSVFDVQAAVGNTADLIEAKGPYVGLIADSYRVEVTTAGTHGSAKYKWTRLSDNYVQTGLTAKKRFIELEQGLFVKFIRDQYDIGDTYTIKVKPLSKLNQTVTWDFSTGDASYVEPDDQPSSTVVSLPVQDPNPAPALAGNFALLSVDPYDGKTMVKIGSKGTAVVNGIVFTTNKKTSEFNNKKIKIIAGDDLSIYALANDIVIEVIESTTTHQQVVDLVNLSTLALSAESLTPTAICALYLAGKTIAGGEAGGFIEFKFNKTIDQASFSADKIAAVYESLDTISQGDLDFTYEINDNVLKIQF